MKPEYGWLLVRLIDRWSVIFHLRNWYKRGRGGSRGFWTNQAPCLPSSLKKLGREYVRTTSKLNISSSSGGGGVPSPLKRLGREYVRATSKLNISSSRRDGLLVSTSSTVDNSFKLCDLKKMLNSNNKLQIWT